MFVVHSGYSAFDPCYMEPPCMHHHIISHAHLLYRTLYRLHMHVCVREVHAPSDFRRWCLLWSMPQVIALQLSSPCDLW